MVEDKEKHGESKPVMRYSVDMPTDVYYQLEALAKQRGVNLAILIRQSFNVTLRLESLRKALNNAMYNESLETDPNRGLCFKLENGTLIPTVVYGYVGLILQHGRDLTKLP